MDYYDSSYYYGSGSTGVAVLGTMMLFIWIISIAIGVIGIIAQWKLFTKAGKAGWISLIPLWNMYTLFEISGMSGWMFLLLCVPFLNFVMLILLWVKIAQAFGKSGLFAVGLIFLCPIFILILAFGNSTYVLNRNNAAPSMPQ